MLSTSRLFAKSAGSALARTSSLLPSTRFSSTTPLTESSAFVEDLPTPIPSATEPTPSPSPSVPSPSQAPSASVPTTSSGSGYFLTAPPRAAVIPISWSAPDATKIPSSPHTTLADQPDNLNLAHHLLPSTPHSPAQLLKSQTEKYIVAKLHAQQLLMHPTDIVTVPRLAGSPALGSQLHLTRVFEVGSRDFTLRAPLGQRLTDVRCSLTVLEHTQSPMSVLHKKKRRKGYQKEIRNKHQWTRLRVGDIEIVERVEDGMGGAGTDWDEQPEERKLMRKVDMGRGEYKVTDGSYEGRLATTFGLVRRGSGEKAPPRPVN